MFRQRVLLCTAPLMKPTTDDCPCASPAVCFLRIYHEIDATKFAASQPMAPIDHPSNKNAPHINLRDQTLQHFQALPAQTSPTKICAHLRPYPRRSARTPSWLTPPTIRLAPPNAPNPRGTPENLPSLTLLPSPLPDPTKHEASRKHQLLEISYSLPVPYPTRRPTGKKVPSRQCVR
jgi:hypothetical protein